MKIERPTNHNFYGEEGIPEENLRKEFGIRYKKQEKQIEDMFSSVFELDTKSARLEILRFRKTKEEPHPDEEGQLILRLYRKYKDSQYQYFIQTGLFAGVLYQESCQFNITARQGGTVFLHRMLNFVNDIYIDTEHTEAKESQEQNEFQQIIAYLFIQSLEKSAILGLPKVYQNRAQRSSKVRGSIDIKTYLKKDIPFRGVLTTKYRELVFVQEIVDVLYMACRILEKNFGRQIHRKILSVYQLLRQNYSNRYPKSDTIRKARGHVVLHNPAYSGFKNTLKYAEIILQQNNLFRSDQSSTLTTHGYLFDIAQLFEVYLEKLLARYFTDWEVTGQTELRVYQGQFYGRRMLPDLVMRHKKTGKVIVFDAKFKRMAFTKNDVDRGDFYQIHSYLQYYYPDVLFGGLIYPLSRPINTDKAYSEQLWENEKHSTKFIVDGIFVTEEMTMTDIRTEEEGFIHRIRELISSCS